MSLAKVELNDIGTLANPASARQALNDNFQKIEEEFEKVVYRDGSVPNSMEADLDMNSNRILNVADAVHDKDAVNKGQVLELARAASEEVWEPRFDELVGQVGNELSRVLKLPPGMSNMSLPSPTPSYVIGWNAAGTALRNYPPGDPGGVIGDLQDRVGGLEDGLSDVLDELSDLQGGLSGLQDEVAQHGDAISSLDDAITAGQVAAQEALDQEIADRIAGDLATATAAAADATAKANAALASAMAAVSALEAQVADITGAPEWDIASTYNPGDLVKYDGSLYRALVTTTGDQPDISPTAWEKVGDYASLGEAVAAALSMATATASDLAVQVNRIDTIVARMPAGEDELASTAFVASELSAIVSDIEAEANRIDAIVARMPAGTGELATAASVSSEASARASADSALSSRVDVVEARMPAGSGELATAASVISVDSASVSRDNALSGRLTAVEARMPAGSGELATASAVNSLSSTVSTQGGQISALASDLSSVSVDLGNTQASVTQLMEVTGSARLVDVRNPSFETDDGWAANADGSGGLPSGVTYETATAHSGSRVLRFTAVSTVVHNMGRTPVRPGERLRVGGWLRMIGSAPNSGARLRIGLRSYDASGAYISGSALVPVDVVMSGRGFTFPSAPDTGIYTVPAGAVSVGLYVQTTNLTSGSVACDDVFIERISETENRFMASHTLALDVNGNISGMVNENDGETSSFSILASIFRVISGPTAGIEWQNGYLRAYALGAQIVLGSNFGSGNDLMLWCGPNIGANNCSKANGTFWVDNTGDGYFAGRVLQGVLRWFNSTTSTASNASVTTGSNPRLGKNVALAARYQYSENWTYLGGTVSPGAGNTAATIVIERRYGSGSWTTLATRTIPGSATAYNNPGSGDPSSWWVSISGEVFATDTASTSNSEYRARITSRSVQSHNPGTDGQPVVINQYLSIEAME